MIYTITLNPSIDHYIFLYEKLKQNDTNRCDKTVNLCGGKGINVGIVCGRLGVPAVCTGFYGGFTGDELIRQLKEQNIIYDFIKTKSETRINTKIVCGGAVTEINSKSPLINEEEAKEFIKGLSIVTSDDTVVLSGSVPDTPGLLHSVLEEIKSKKARFIADTSGSALKECIKYRPYLVKPNRAELAAYFGLNSDNIDIKEYAEKLVSKGAENVIVSDGENGAYFASKEGCRYLPVNDIGLKAVNATGAGDSMIAGFLYGESKGIDPFICAVSAGSAAAYYEGLFDAEIFKTVINSYLTV